WNVLDAESNQEKPKIWFNITDQNGMLVKRIEGKTSKGIHRVSWDLRFASKSGVTLQRRSPRGGGALVIPGTFSVSMSKVVDGITTKLSEAQTFEVKPLYKGALPGISTEDIIAFRKDLQLFQQDMTATSAVLDKSLNKVKAMQTALLSVDQEADDIVSMIHDVRLELLDLEEAMDGSKAKSEIGEKSNPTPSSRMSVGRRGLRTTYGPTKMHRESLEIGKGQLAVIKQGLTEISEQTIPDIERALQKAGAPWIEGQGLISNF
ncbi:MAG: hypothetical protein OEQ53_17430, partial [Saprospiraceae bacterium]|nr:hypothetical protein [Saprospiraceae bacterium]